LKAIQGMNFFQKYTKGHVFNLYVKLLPFLILYIVVCLVFSNNATMVGDEPRYWQYAENLLNGFYAFENNTFLWNGPGYPIVLMPFRWLDTPLIVPKLLNALLLYFSLILFCKTLAFYLSEKKSFCLTVLLGLYYPNFMDSVPFLMTEALAFFFTSVFMFYICKVAREQRRGNFSRNIFMATLSLAALTLTKVIFGYVIIVMLLVALLLSVVKQLRQQLKPYLIITALSIGLCSPYLFYTYSLTGQVYYWGNSGSMLMYWMSSPHPDELGDWHAFNLNEHPKLKEHHGEYIHSIMGLSPVERDKELKRKAIENIKQNKKKYVYNWVANVGRMFFSYPLSYIEPSNGIFYFLIPNMFLLVFMMLALIISLKFIRKIPIEILFLVFTMAVYLGGTSMISSYARFLYVAIPILLLWIAFVFSRYLKVDAGFSKAEEND